MANPTTNYGWPMPTSTDLVTDLPADFALFGQPVDTSLKALNPETTLGDIAYRSSTSNTNTRLGIGTNGQVLAVSSGVPAWTTTADVTPLTTKGDVFTFSTVDARIGVGANNTVLTADSAEATGLKWATPASGKVLQVVFANTSTTATSNTTTFATTNLTATITPTLNTSKVMVLVTQNGVTVDSGANQGLKLKLLRGSTDLAIVSDNFGQNTGNQFLIGMSAAINWLDSPATTSATTYVTHFARTQSSGTVYCQSANTTATSSIILLEIGA